MVGSFCLCYTPYTALAMYIVNNHNHGVDLRFVTIPAFFPKSACVYNPIIYCFMNKQVKLSIYIPKTWFFSTMTFNSKHLGLHSKGFLGSTGKAWKPLAG